MEKNIISKIGGEMKDTTDNLINDVVNPIKETIGDIRETFGFSQDEEESSDLQ